MDDPGVSVNPPAAEEGVTWRWDKMRPKTIFISDRLILARVW
jgi:hypothetical protein